MGELRFPKTERLCSRKLIDELFASGAQCRTHGLRFLFLPLADHHHAAMAAGQLQFSGPVQVVFIVPKRRFRTATLRNRRKRRLREAWRHERVPLKRWLLENDRQLALAIFDQRREEGSFEDLRKGVAKGLKLVQSQIKNQD
ncbi:MAG: ribonuclease P protein component [Bacteroidota bacterium]